MYVSSVHNQAMRPLRTELVNKGDKRKGQEVGKEPGTEPCIFCRGQLCP